MPDDLVTPVVGLRGEVSVHGGGGGRGSMREVCSKGYVCKLRLQRRKVFSHQTFIYEAFEPWPNDDTSIYHSLV